MKTSSQSAFTRIEIGLSLFIAALCIVVTAVLVRSTEKADSSPGAKCEEDAGETYIDLEYEVDEEGVSLAPVRTRDKRKSGKVPAESVNKTNAAPSMAGSGQGEGKTGVQAKAGEGARSKAAVAKPENAKSGDKKKSEKPAKQAGAGKDDVINIPPEVAKRLEELEQAEWSRATEVKLLNVVRDWGRKHPAEALEYALSIERRGTRNSAVGSVLNSWAKADPDAAYEWFKSESASDSYSLEGQTRSLFKNLASKNVSGALSKVWGLPSEDMKRMALGTVAGEMISLGREREVLSLYNTLDGAADRKLVLDVVLHSMGRYEPEYLGRWVTSMQDKGDRSKSLDVLMSVWANDHPRSAAEWVSSELPADADRARQIAKVTGAWAKESPSEAADWLLSMFPPSSQTDPAVGTFARSVMSESPEYAGTWSFAVTNPDQRWKLMEEIGEAWLKKDRAKAVAFIQSTDLPSAAKSRLLK